MDLLAKSQSAWATTSHSILKKPYRAGFAAFFLTFVLLYLYIDRSSLVPITRTGSVSSTVSSTSELARNRTLGFQKIFYISLPHRDDRQDGMTLAASMTDIDLTMMPGSTAEDVHEKVIPPSWHSARDDPALGCWRSHANVWRKIISENIATALVLEDDADWDVNVKEQMLLQSQAILSHPNLVTNDSRVEDGKPYRDDWDIFFLGACQLRAYGNETSEAGPFIVVKDAYMAQRDKLRDSYLNALDHFGVKEEGERVLFRVASTLCTTGYAVSKKGAARLLYNIGWKDFAFPIDNELSWKIEKGIIRGITTSPPIFNMYKTHSSRDSDINNTTKNEQASNADGSTADIRNSARMAMNNYYAPDTPPEEYWAPKLNVEPVKVGDA